MTKSCWSKDSGRKVNNDEGPVVGQRTEVASSIARARTVIEGHISHMMTQDMSIHVLDVLACNRDRIA
jgi:hypothetical protein